METAFESKLLKMETAFAIQLEELRNEIKELKEGFRNLWSFVQFLENQKSDPMQDLPK